MVPDHNLYHLMIYILPAFKPFLRRMYTVAAALLLEPAAAGVECIIYNCYPQQKYSQLLRCIFHIRAEKAVDLGYLGITLRVSGLNSALIYILCSSKDFNGLV